MVTVMFIAWVDCSCLGHLQWVQSCWLCVHLVRVPVVAWREWIFIGTEAYQGHLITSPRCQLHAVSRPASGAVFYKLAVHLYESHVVLRCNLNKWEQWTSLALGQCLDIILYNGDMSCHTPAVGWMPTMRDLPHEVEHGFIPRISESQRHLSAAMDMITIWPWPICQKRTGTSWNASHNGHIGELITIAGVLKCNYQNCIFLHLIVMCCSGRVCQKATVDSSDLLDISKFYHLRSLLEGEAKARHSRPVTYFTT